MNNTNELLKTDIHAYLHQHETKDLLRLLTCGSVDDGKSTLIGRLLHDSQMIYEDQLAAITKDSKKVGTTGDRVDLALLVDGLQSEREQGITIDVAYRYFSTDKRKFIIADTPGHEQYTRNMVTGASTAQVAIILIDAREGVKVQTKRHSFLVNLLGIKHVVVAINKMDLMGYREDVYDNIKAQYQSLNEKLGIPDVHYIPLSALEGDNVVNLSDKTPWYHGKSLIHLLESISVSRDQANDFRFPVQYVNRPNLDYRGFSGTVVSGTVRVGDSVIALPSQKRSRIKSIDTFDGQLESAHTKQAVTLTLTDEIDISRGDMLVEADKLPLLSNRYVTHLVWMNEQPLQLEAGYRVKFASKQTVGSITRIKHQINVNTMESHPTDTLQLNEIALVELSLEQLIAVDPYKANRATGSFIVVDRVTNATVGAGMIVSALDAKTTATNQHSYSEFELELNALVRKHFPHWQAIDLSK